MRGNRKQQRQLRGSLLQVGMAMCESTRKKSVVRRSFRFPQTLFVDGTTSKKIANSSDLTFSVWLACSQLCTRSTEHYVVTGLIKST